MVPPLSSPHPTALRNLQVFSGVTARMERSSCWVCGNGLSTRPGGARALVRLQLRDSSKSARLSAPLPFSGKACSVGICPPRRMHTRSLRHALDCLQSRVHMRRGARNPRAWRAPLTSGLSGPSHRGPRAQSRSLQRQELCWFLVRCA